MHQKLAALLERTHGIGRKNNDARKTDILGNRTLENFFSEMPLRIPSLGSLQSPYAIITRTAANSASFSAVDVSVTDHGLGNVGTPDTLIESVAQAPPDL